MMNIPNLCIKVSDEKTCLHCKEAKVVKNGTTSYLSGAAKNGKIGWEKTMERFNRTNSAGYRLKHEKSGGFYIENKQNGNWDPLPLKAIPNDQF